VAYIERLPHATFDENQLHVMILSLMKDYDECLNAVKRFLPYIDNWATCDQLTPKVFARHADELLPQVEEWVKSEAEYTIRFGMKMLMSHYLGERFNPDMPKLVAAVHREEYYIRMMQAWYFATALAKQWDSVVQHIETPILDPWTHNKAIQKAIESYRITPEQKDYLRTLKVGTGTQN
jgi:3-methyladenine DNA glycosylase AlkD